VPRRSEAKAGVQTISEEEINHGAGFKLDADACVRVQQPLQICLECRSKSKKCDKQLTHIVRVSVSGLLIVMVEQSCYLFNSHGVVFLQALLKALVVHQLARLLNVLAKSLSLFIFNNLYFFR
jgi:hypothetical protein